MDGQERRTTVDSNIQDSVNPVESKVSGLNGFSDFTMKDVGILNQLNDSMADKLADALPSMALYWKDGANSHAETKKGLPGEEIKSDDLTNSHVKASKTVEDGRNATTAEYPNGIGLKVKDGPKPETIGGRFHVVKSEAEISHRGDLHKKGNSWVDAKGREIIKRNDDGSYTIDSGEGFFRQGPNGIEKVTVLRHRNGSFSELNTKDPLGDLKPSDYTEKKKK